MPLFVYIKGNVLSELRGVILCMCDLSLGVFCLNYIYVAIRSFRRMFRFAFRVYDAFLKK